MLESRYPAQLCGANARQSRRCEFSLDALPCLFRTKLAGVTALALSTKQENAPTQWSFSICVSLQYALAAVRQKNVVKRVKGWTNVGRE